MTPPHLPGLPGRAGQDQVETFAHLGRHAQRRRVDGVVDPHASGAGVQQRGVNAQSPGAEDVGGAKGVQETQHVVGGEGRAFFVDVEGAARQEGVVPREGRR